MSLRLPARAACLGLLLLAAPAGAQEPSLDRLREAFDPDAGGIVLTYQELLELLGDAKPKPQPAVEDSVPAPYVLLGAKAVGEAGEQVARFRATIDLEILETREWVVVPLGLPEASLESVQTAGGEPVIVGPLAQLGADPRVKQKRRGKPRATGYGVLLRGAGRIQLEASFAVPIAARPGESRFALTLPQVALASLELSVPQGGLRIGAGNALARESLTADADTSRIRAFFAAGATAQVRWNPRPKVEVGKAPRDPLLFADVATSLRLEEGVLQTTTRVDYRIHQAPCGTFRLRFPAGYTLLSVSGKGMSSYPTPAESGGAQTLTVRLRRSARERYRLELKLEKVLGEGVREVRVPRIETLGTERESGVLAARGSQFLSLEPHSVQGLSQLDAAKLPGDVQQALGWKPGQARPPLGFGYLRQPYELNLVTSQIEPEVEGKVLSLALVRDEEIALASTVRYTVSKRGIFGVRLQLPPGYQLLECGPRDLVKDHRLESGEDPEAAETLVVDFASQRQPGSFHLTLYGLVRRDPQPDEGEVAMAMPRLGLLDVVKESGVLALGAQSHLQLTLEQKESLWPVPVRELSSLGFPHGVKRGEELIFGFRYGRPEGVSAQFQARKREPKVTAGVETLADFQEDVVRVQATIRYAVEYAGIQQVRLEVPAALGNEEALKFEREGIKDQRVEVEGERAVWTIALQGKRTGSFALRCSYTIKLDGFAAGHQKNVTLAPFRVLDCFSQTGDVALKKHENLVITDFEKLLVEKRDKRDLPGNLRSEGVIGAYRTLGHPHRLTLRVTKYDFKAPLGILVRHLHQDEVLGEEGWKVEAFLSVQNSSEQFLTVALPPGATVRGLKVDGKTEKWRDGGEVAGRPAIQVHLGEVTKTRRDDPFQIRLRYNLPGGLSAGRLEPLALEFPLGEGSVPVARTTRSLYLPPEFAYLAFASDGTKHFEEDGLWEGLAHELGLDDARRRLPYEGARGASDAIARLKGMASNASVGLYPTLDIPRRQQPFLFESLGPSLGVSVSAMAWGLYYTLSILVLVVVVGLGMVLEKKKVLGPVAFPCLAGSLLLLGALVLGRPAEAFLTSGVLGAAGLGGFFALRGLWREATTRRHERRQAEQVRETEVARARAHAAEAEARLKTAAQG